ICLFVSFPLAITSYSLLNVIVKSNSILSFISSILGSQLLVYLPWPCVQICFFSIRFVCNESLEMTVFELSQSIKYMVLFGWVSQEISILCEVFALNFCLTINCFPLYKLPSN